MFSACKGCGLAPIRGTSNVHGLCCGCHYKLKCRMCRRRLDPHLYSDSDVTICNACVKKSTQGGGFSVYKALRNTLEQHVFDGGDDQSLEFFINSNDGEIRRMLQDAVDVHKLLIFTLN